MAITISGSGITSANIADGTIVNADVNDVAASKLTGALPAISGASLTNLPGGGKIKQIKTTIAHTLVTANGTSLSELSSNYRVSIAPITSSNTIKVDINLPFNADGIISSTIMTVDVQRSTNGGSSWSPVTGSGASHASLGNRFGVSVGGTRRSNGYDTNDMNICSFSILDLPATSSTCIYSIFFRAEATGNVRFGHSAGNSSVFGWMTPITLTAYEMEVS